MTKFSTGRPPTAPGIRSSRSRGGAQPQHARLAGRQVDRKARDEGEAVRNRHDLAEHARVRRRLELEDHGDARPRLGEPREQPLDARQLVEEVAVAGRVRAAHVERHVVRLALKQLEGAGVVVVDVGLDRRPGRVVRLDEVHAQRYRQPQLREPPRHDLGAVVRHAVADDDRVVLRQPEEPRPRVAVRGVCGDRAHLEMAEAELGEQRQRAAVLVEAGGEPERVRERQAAELDTEAAHAARERHSREPADRGRPPGERRGPERELVRPLGLEPEEQGPHGRLVQRAHWSGTLAAGACASGS